jgi:hypothetical protein
MIFNLQNNFNVQKWHHLLDITTLRPSYDHSADQCLAKADVYVCVWLVKVDVWVCVFCEV